MANINTENIENFDSMTPEEKVAALMAYDIPDEVDMSKYVLKTTFDNKASEAANLAKQLKEKETALKSKATEQMTEDERWQEKMRELQEASEQQTNELKEQLAAFQRKDTLRDYQTNLTLLGFDEKLAPETAEALADNNIEKVFTNLRKFLDAYRKNVEAELMRNTPQPHGGAKDDGDDGPDMKLVKKFAEERAGMRSGVQEKSFAEKWHK